MGYFGRATSCKELLQRDDGTDPSGVYQLFDPTSNSLYEVFCDFTSEKGFVWTLIESFSFRYSDEFKDKAFYEDHPLNQEAFTWNKFRLSLPRMNATVKRSTHVRATCNFNTEELKYEDYLRAKLSDIHLMRFSLSTCKNSNLLASAEITGLTTRLISSKGIFGMRIVVRIIEDLPVSAYPKVQ